jgi:hypothetical protein
MMGHMSFDPIIILPRDGKPKGYIFWLHAVPSYYFRLFIDKNSIAKEEIYWLLYLKLWPMKTS